VTTKEEREAREKAASAEATAAGLRRIAAALEALLELGVAIKAMADRELRTHIAEPPNEGSAK
jgi:hypothetical protein